MACALVVDNDADTREALRAILEEEGYSVLEAANGRAAIEQLSAKRAHIVLLDTRMPVMDGAEFLEWLKGQSRYDLVPVIVLSADTAPFEHPRATAVMRKPYDLDALLHIMKKFCT